MAVVVEAEEAVQRPALEQAAEVVEEVAVQVRVQARAVHLWSRTVVNMRDPPEASAGRSPPLRLRSRFRQQREAYSAPEQREPTCR